MHSVESAYSNFPTSKPLKPPSGLAAQAGTGSCSANDGKTWNHLVKLLAMLEILPMRTASINSTASINRNTVKVLSETDHKCHNWSMPSKRLSDSATVRQRECHSEPSHAVLKCCPNYDSRRPRGLCLPNPIWPKLHLNPANPTTSYDLHSQRGLFNGKKQRWWSSKNYRRENEEFKVAETLRLMQ